MPYSASQWRGLIQQESARYNATPGGAPPWQIAEGMVNLESGGDPNNYTDTGTGDVAIGLGQITTSGYEFGLYRQKFPQGSVDLTDPQTNIRIMMLGLDSKEELGIQAEKEGKPHALANWYTTIASYFGAATNEGLTEATDKYGTSGRTYIAAVQKYMREVLGLTQEQIEKLGGPDAQSGLQLGLFGDATNAVTGGISGAISGFEHTIGEIAKRMLPLLVGVFLLGYGAYRVSQA